MIYMKHGYVTNLRGLVEGFKNYSILLLFNIYLIQWNRNVCDFSTYRGNFLLLATLT